MVYTQAKVKTDIYLQLLKGTTIPGADLTKHQLKLKLNLYGLKDGQVTWHEHIKAGLKEQGFHQSTVSILMESSNFNNKKQLIIASILLAWVLQLTL